MTAERLGKVYWKGKREEEQRLMTWKLGKVVHWQGQRRNLSWGEEQRMMTGRLGKVVHWQVGHWRGQKNRQG